MTTHARVLCRNLKLLDFDFDQNSIPSEFEGFLAFFRIPRKPQFISILRFLLLALDEQYFGRELSQHTCPSSETALKCVISKWLRESRPAIRLPASVFSVLGYPGGATAVEFLSVISSFVIVSKIPTIPDCTDDLVSKIHRLLRTKARDQITFRTVENSLRAHLLKRENELTTAKRSLAETVNEVKQFSKNRLILTGLTGSSDLENANQLVQRCQDHQRTLISEVLTNRKRLETLLQDYASFQPVLSNILEHTKTQPLPVLNAEHFKARKLPDLFAGAVKEILPLRQDGKIDLHRFLHYADAVFSIGCQLLDLSQPTVGFPNGAASDDTVIDWCSRVFQRSARLCDSPAQPSPVSIKQPQRPDSDLDELIQSMRSFISSHQPNESQLTPLTSYSRPSRGSASKQLHISFQPSSNSDQSWAKFHQPVEVVSDLSPLRAFEFSELSATPTALEQRSSASVGLSSGPATGILKSSNRDLLTANQQTDRYSPKPAHSVAVDFSPLRAFEISQLSGTPTTLDISQSVGLLKSSNRESLNINRQPGLYDFKASLLQTEENRRTDPGAIENIKPFGLYDFKASLLQTEENKTTDLEAIENIEAFDQSTSFEVEYATPSSKWLHMDSRAPDTPLTPTERHSSVHLCFEHSGPREALRTMNLNPPSTSSVAARDPIPAPPCPKSQLVEDIDSSQFNLFGDSMDFVNELVPSSPP